MRRTLLALSLALLPLAAAQAQIESHEHEHEHEHQEAHASLGKHEHGVASLDVALDGSTLEIRLESPAMNLVGFEHAPGNAADQARLDAARALLEQPSQLFDLAAAADCRLTESALESPLFGNAEHDHPHSYIDASYQLRCEHPQALQALDLSPLFARFPALRQVAVQLIGHSGQQGAELTPEQPRLSF
ncbi:DUF2796 domain-containing protein [Pseudomonas zhanjiangensis]|uniref:DUF2796 domain-containing protein n=1 Tax=Pseudomonas zhanjiangensis TaxID=3239015 RepID=A0ABV3YVV8_9PSED